MLAGVALQGDLDESCYIVTWRAVSEDGHPIRGAFVFTVGGAPQASDTLVADLVSGDGGAVVGLVQRLTTAATYAAVLFAVGALLATGALGRAATERSATWVRRAALAGIVVSVLAVPLQAMAASGDGLPAAVDGQQLWTVLTASVGLAAIVRVIGLVGVLVTTGRARVVAGGMALLSFLIDGHTRTVEPIWLLLAGDALHLVAGAVWFGGLVVLARELWARQLIDDPVGGATVLAGSGDDPEHDDLPEPDAGDHPVEVRTGLRHVPAGRDSGGVAWEVVRCVGCAARRRPTRGTACRASCRSCWRTWRRRGRRWTTSSPTSMPTAGRR